MVIKRGEIWWAELGLPKGSGPGYRRPVVIIQANAFNQSRIDTTIVATITSNLALAEAPGNVLVSARESKLPRASVINVSQLVTVDRQSLSKKITKLPTDIVEKVDLGLRAILSLGC